MPIEPLIVGQLKTNCYLVYDDKSRETLIVDPGDDADYIISKLSALSLKPMAILATHGHFDHVLAVTELKLAYKIPFYLHQKDEFLLARMQSSAKRFTGVIADPPAKVNRFLDDNQKFQITNFKFQIIYSPGHTPGGICLYCKSENFILTGDTIFANGAFGRTDLQGGDEKIIKKSIKKILSFPEKTIIYPGHGESTTIGREKRYYDFSNI